MIFQFLSADAVSMSMGGGRSYHSLRETESLSIGSEAGDEFKLHYAGRIRQGVQHPQQERCGGRSHNLASSAATEQCSSTQDRSAASRACTVSDATPTRGVPDHADQ